MRSRCSVAVIAALIASSLLPTPAKLADASADVPNPLEYISRPQTLDAPDGARVEEAHASVGPDRHDHEIGGHLARGRSASDRPT